MSDQNRPDFNPDDPAFCQWLNDHTILFDFNALPVDEGSRQAKAKRHKHKQPSSRSRGGQPGNSNALKYGFYSRRLPARELDGLDQTTANSLKDEIDVMRVFSRKVAELGSDVDELDKATDLLRVLSLATTSINRLVKTHSRMPDPLMDPAALLRQSLLELEDEWPELKAFGDQFRNKPDKSSPSSSNGSTTSS